MTYWDDLVEQLQKRQQHAEMRQEADGHRVVNLLDGMSRDDLSAVHDMLATITAAGDNARAVAAVLLGTVTGLLHNKHGVCWSCGKPHEAEILGD